MTTYTCKGGDTQVEEPRMVISYPELVQGMQKRFVEQGKMKPVAIQTFLTEADLQIEGYREIYGEFLRKDWTTLFPNIPFSETEFNNALDDALTLKRQEAEKEFRSLIATEKKWLVVQNFVFRKPTAVFLGSSTMSTISIPFLLWLALQPSNISLLIGGVGLIFNIIVIIFFFIKMMTQKKE